MKYKIPVILIVLSIMLFSPIPPSSYAKDTNLTSIYLMSKTCPKEYVDYAQENIGRYIYSLEPSERRSVKDMKLGSPFSFCNTDSDLFYFPIITNGSITHMLRVYKKSTGDCGAVIGKSFVQEINELASKTSNESPLILMMEEDTVVAYINKERIIIQEYPQGTVGSDSYILPGEFEKVFSTKESDYIMVDITSECSDCTYILVNPAGEMKRVIPPICFWERVLQKLRENKNGVLHFLQHLLPDM